MKGTDPSAHRQYTLYSSRNMHQIRQLEGLPAERLRGIRTAAAVFPFRVNNYVIEELIDWERIPEDPVFQLTFPQPEMLGEPEFERIDMLLRNQAPGGEVRKMVRRLQMALNPHPAGQMELNVPVENGRIFRGMQHKYRETVLYFPSHGQTCHAFCTYCFRWAQFAGLDNMKFADSNPGSLIDYLNLHPEITDVLITGGDPLTMSTRLLRRYIEPILQARPGGLATIRFGTKVPAYWPYRFLTDGDADDLMRLFEQIVASGYHLAIMAHISHPRELETPAGAAAIQRILGTGANVRCQAPLIRRINDSADIWCRMWREQVKIGAVPYYMFVQRDTGPRDYFKVPLARAYRIFSDAYRRVSGLCRTVRGPSMSATPGKVLIDGVTEIAGEKVFVLKFIQGRKQEWVNRLFFARYDEEASWLDELLPAFGKKQFFFKPELRLLKSIKSSQRMESDGGTIGFPECA